MSAANQNGEAIRHSVRTVFSCSVGERRHFQSENTNTDNAEFVLVWTFLAGVRFFQEKRLSDENNVCSSSIVARVKMNLRESVPKHNGT